MTKIKKIAILRCLKTSAACAGTGCLRAFNERSEGFSVYLKPGEKAIHDYGLVDAIGAVPGEVSEENGLGDYDSIQLAAVWTCNGCGQDRLTNTEGLDKKISRMAKNKINVVHLSHCTVKKKPDGTYYRCPVIVAIAKRLAAEGIMIADGTHGSKATGKLLKLV